MTLTVYHLKTCDTCRKAIKALNTAGHDLTLIDVRADGVPAADLNRIVSAAGYETVLNTRSTTWRRLSDADKSDMDQDKAIKLMSARPTLIKRPVIDTGAQIFVGWKPEVQTELL